MELAHFAKEMLTNKWKRNKMGINKWKIHKNGNQQVKLGRSRFHGFPILDMIDRKSEDQISARTPRRPRP